MIRKSAFTPARGLSNRHLQTVLASAPLLRPRPPLQLRRETLELPDGDFIHVDWTAGRGPVVLVLHGLEGSIRSRYAAAVMHAVHDRGWRGALVHFRGCSGIPNRLARSYHAGDTADLRFFLEQLKTRFPREHVAAVGYSLGGNVLLKYLGESGADSDLTTAVAVSVPFDLQDACQAITYGFSRFYEWLLMRRMKASLKRKFGRRMPADLRPALSSRGFFEYDDLVTAPLNGFANAPDYYRESSCRQFLKDIRTPTLILHSADDPFMTRAALPTDDDLSPSVTLELSEHGGHVGFLTGSAPWNARPWLEQRIVSHFADFLGDATPDGSGDIEPVTVAG